MAIGETARTSPVTDLQTALIASIPSTMALVDHNGTILAVNDSWRAFAEENGYPGDDFGVGTNYLHVCRNESGHQDESAEAARGIRSVLSGQATQFQLEYPCHAPHQHRWFNLTVKPIRFADFRGAVLYHTNITDRKLAEIAAVESRDAALAADKAKSLFIASATHEFRTPLTSIVGFAEMAQRSAAKGNLEQQAVCVEEIRNSSTHLLTMINDLMDLYETQVDDFRIDDTPVDLEAVVEAALRMLEPQAAQAGVALGLDADPILPRLRGDASRLSQIVVNLLSNAIKFTPEGGRVMVDLAAASDGVVVLTVTDTGVGIPEEDMGRVLAPFGKSDHEYERNPQGTGLGLPLVKRLVEGHGGRFRLESEIGGGTTAIAEFPERRTVRRRLGP